MNPRSTALTLRLVGGFTVVLTLLAAFLYLQSAPPTSLTIIISAAVFVLDGAIALSLFGIAAVLDHAAASQQDLARAIGRLEDEIDLLAARLDSPQTVAGESNAVPENFLNELSSLHEAFLLPNAEREKQSNLRVLARANESLNDAGAAIDQKRWLDADRAIGDVEAAFPELPAVREMRSRFVQAHAAAESETITAARSEIESDMSRGLWDEAISHAETLLAHYPANAVAQQMLQRVTRERTIYTESTVQRLFDEIRHDSERRQWRRALEHAQTLLQKFSTHERADRIRQQLHTLQENAEIEERHECEAKISDLVKSRRFDDAIRLGEDLMQRFPTSLQAETIQKLLPRLRELAGEQASP